MSSRLMNSINIMFMLLKIISPTVFAMMVVMAIVTTLATTPILQLIGKKGEESGSEGTAHPA